MKGACTFTDSLYLNALGNPDAVFVIQINGALTTSTYSKVLLINGAQAKNVYWKIEGAVSINNYSVFCGTIVSNNGALGAINTGVTLNGRAFTTAGALTTSSIISTMPADCSLTTTNPMNAEKTNIELTVAPNPFGSTTTIKLKNDTKFKICEFKIYNAMGKEVMKTTINNQGTTLDMSKLMSGIYFYKAIADNKVIQSGKLISNQ
jgi:hypothetical protein